MLIWFSLGWKFLAVKIEMIEGVYLFEDDISVDFYIFIFG
jgi:hypothetical protein